jgi:hypothetical protein
MHYHCEIVIPPVMNVEDAITSILKPYCEHGDEEDGYKKHAFWDFWSIGGRWSGNKMLAQYPKAKLDAFYDWLKSEHVTVSGLQCGKQELSPAEQIPKVDAKWNEMFPSNEFRPCPLFRHSNDPYNKTLGGALPGDVQRIADVADELTCSRVIFAAPSYDMETKERTGPLEAVFMLIDTAWNGCNHMKVNWDGKFHSALREYLEYTKSYREDYAAKVRPTHDWLAVTVDYHS